MSKLLQICNGLASVDIDLVFDPSLSQYDEVVGAFKPQEIPSRVGVGMLPKRLVFPPGVYGTGIQSTQIVTKSILRIDWRVVDLFLYKPLKSMIAIGDTYHVLAHYIGKYVETMNSCRKPASNTRIMNYDSSVDVYEYPRGSGNWYNGVQMIVIVSETIGE